MRRVAPMLTWDFVTVGLGLAVMVAPIALYLTSGILDGFLAADDFGWLTTARDADWRHLFSFGGYDHFYRPVTRLWFFGVVRLCHDSTACYHSLNLAVHVVNAVLFAGISFITTRDRIFSALAALVFAISPGYVEAVVWVSAITELLSTFFLLTTALLVLHAVGKSSSIARYVAALTAMLALFAHEASAVLFAVLPFLLWISGRIGQVRRRDIWPLAIVAAIFLVTVVLANHRNVIFTEGRYTFGSHMIVHGLNYLVSMYVGPHRWTGRLFVFCAGAAVAAFGPRMARNGVVWIVITMLPFLGFTWGNTARYLYLPTMGFGWVIGALLLSLYKRLIEYASVRAVTATVSLVAVIVIARFGIFTSRAIKGDLEYFDIYRDYVQAVINREPEVGTVNELIVPAPADRRFDIACIQPMLRWTLGRPDLTVIVESTADPAR